jgi:hypothetical protein
VTVPGDSAETPTVPPEDDGELWREERYPPYVRMAEQRERWDVCEEVAEATSRLHEPSGEPDRTFVWFTTRALYRSDIPTGTPADRIEAG